MLQRVAVVCISFLALAAAAIAVTERSARAADTVQVGVWVGAGADAEDRAPLLAALATDDRIRVTELAEGGKALRGDLAGIDVLVVGGGSGSAIAKGLGPEGAEAVAAFVRRGGGFVGVGAGCYLGARGYNEETRALELVDVALFDRSNWKRRGEGVVELEVTALGGVKGPLGALPERFLFSRGALLQPARGHDREPSVALARFATDLLAGQRGAGAMLGAEAIVAAPFGKGRAVLMAVLPHRREETVPVLARAVHWAGGAGDALPGRTPGPIRGTTVAVLDDEGCIGSCVINTFRCLDEASQPFVVRRVNGREVAAGALDDYDVAILPGGSATGQSGALGEEGRAKLKEFVAEGGGYIGICAGAYLGAAEPTRYGLALAAVRCVDTKHWKRGEGAVDLSPVGEGFAELTGIAREGHRMLYANGPLLEAMDVPGLPAVETLLRFESDIHGKDAPAGVMPGKIAALKTTYEKGRVVLFSTHPELTGGYEGALVRSVAWARGK